MKLTNRSNRNVSEIVELLKDFYPFAKKRLKFDKDPELVFESDEENAKKTLGAHCSLSTR